MPNRFLRAFDSVAALGAGGGAFAWLVSHLDVVTGVLGALGALGGVVICGMAGTIKLYQLRATRRAFRAGKLLPPS